MDDYESLSHSKWECKYHVVFIPKYRRKTLYGELRQHLGEVFRKLAMQKESRVEEGTHPTSAVLSNGWYFAKRVTLSLALRSSGDAGRGFGRVGAAAALVAG
ncbi:transposase IS200 like protein [mine drainage metagenome]|uniref:Transposase IS200 like protein n=1 Tax=mine drainage metagenome TaxID=410659 RepID=A0A1J5QBF0_9ZZZZ